MTTTRTTLFRLGHLRRVASAVLVIAALACVLGGARPAAASLKASQHLSVRLAHQAWHATAPLTESTADIQLELPSAPGDAAPGDGS